MNDEQLKKLKEAMNIKYGKIAQRPKSRGFRERHYTAKQFQKEFLGDIDLETVVELLKEKFPENFV